MALIANAAMIVLELIGLYQVRSRVSWRMLAFYTQLSNLIAFVTSILFVVLGPETAVPFRYLSTCMLVMTFCVTVFVLIPLGGDPRKLLFSGNGIFHHLLCPVLSLLSYLLWEQPASGFLILALPAVVTLGYGMVMLWLNARGAVDGPYPFFKVRQQTVLQTILWMTALLALIALISWGIVSVHA